MGLFRNCYTGFSSANGEALQTVESCCCDDNKVKMALKSGRKQKENPVARNGEGKR